MPDFSPSGLYGLPPLTVDALRLGGDPRVLGWLQEAVQEGDLLNRDDPAWEQADKGMRYIVGEQASREQLLLRYVPFAVINKSRTATQAHVSALTDIKPLFSFKAVDPTFQFQGDLLNKLVVAWWMSTMADLTLGDTVKYALAAGTGDLAFEWNPQGAYGQGDHQIIAKDFRDTLPIRPSYAPSVQHWQGVIFREAHSVNAMRDKYPQWGSLFKAAPDNLLTTIMSRFRRAVARIQSPGGDTLSGLAGIPQARPIRPGDVVLYRAASNDLSRNLTNRPIPMGDPMASWSYVVDPGELMYPHKRLIVATPELVLYDGPSPFVHGMYPFARLKLWSVPWCFLGLSVLHDTMPIQDGINDTMADLRLGLKPWTNPDVQFNRKETSRAFRMALDPRQPGKRVEVSGLTATQEPYKKHDGPNPQVLALLLETYRELNQVHDSLSGVANLQSLLQLRQMPGPDTIQKYYEALTPEIRSEGRQIELFLREVAEMFKVNTFQFMTSARRVNILGDAGVALEDFDYDPDTMVPAMQPTTTQVDPATGAQLQLPTPGYAPEFDASRSRLDRVKAFARHFVFLVAPNSLLAMNAQERKMLNLQLARMGYLDFWTMHESLETPNVGTPPPIPLPPLQPPPITDPQALAQGILTGQYILDPMQPGQILEMRVPMTVTERLQAQQLLGIGMTENPAGRKASGQESPQFEEKTDASTGETRSTVTESDK